MTIEHFAGNSAFQKAKSGARFGFLLSLFVLTACVAQPTSVSSGSVPRQAVMVDTYVKIFTGVVAGLGALFGLPLTLLQFRKTRAEIRKLELEAKSLESGQVSTEDVLQGHRIVVDHSEKVTITILTDPRYLGPLLLLLDFIIAWVILSLASYALGVFLSGPIRTVILGLLALLLLIPILREARRLKKILQPASKEEGHRKQLNDGG